MSITCVLFAGFQQSRLNDQPNAYSEWIGQIQRSEITTVVLNATVCARESLNDRWRRLKEMHSSLWTSEDALRILGYSMGCHLAVKFAAEPGVIERVKELCLIAPDPKFRRNALDADESAYEQAGQLWNSTKCPGDEMCQALNAVAGRIESVIQVIYSKQDTVALWEGNAELMERTCRGDKFNWTGAAIGEEANSVLFRVQLDPSDARGEFWIHEQLFANARAQQQREAEHAE